MGTQEWVTGGTVGAGVGGAVGPESLTIRVTVANQTARYALTSADVQAGDLVRQTDTGRLYEVVDVEELDNSAGYQDLDEASLAALATHAAGSGVHDVAGVTGLQAALDAKAASSHTHLLAAGATDVTATAAELNKLAGTPAGLTSTELGYVDGVTSAIQTQLDAKAAKGNPVAGVYYPLGASQRSGSIAIALNIVTTIPNTAASNGAYTLDIAVVHATSGLSYAGKLSFVMSGGAVSGTPILSGLGPTLLPAVAVGIKSSVVQIQIDTAAGLHDVSVVVVSGLSSAFFTGWIFGDSIVSGATAATRTNKIHALECTTLAMAGALSGVTTIAHSGAVTMSGSPASAGASVRHRHGAGGTTHIVDNVSSSGGIAWAQNATTILGFNADKSATVDATFGASLASALGAGPKTGDIIWSTRSTPDTGRLAPDGSAVSRTTYAALFAICGTTYGAGNGTTTFNLPSIPGRVIVGAGSGSGLTARTAGDTGGVESVTLTAAQSGLPSHSHSIPSQQDTSSSNGLTRSAFSPGGTAVSTNAAGGTDASQSHTNMQPYIVLYPYIVT